MLPVNIRKVDGIPLDAMGGDDSGEFWAMAIIVRDWNSFYFMLKRNNWSDEDYFEYAKQKIDELGIYPP